MLSQVAQSGIQDGFGAFWGLEAFRDQVKFGAVGLSLRAYLKNPKPCVVVGYFCRARYSILRKPIKKYVWGSEGRLQDDLPISTSSLLDLESCQGSALSTLGTTRQGLLDPRVTEE